MPCRTELALGAYVLHALEAQEADAVEQHLVECPACHQEVGDLAFTASLLALLDPEDVQRLDEPARRGAGQGGAPRRLRRRAVTAAAAAVLVGVVAVPALGLRGGHDQPSSAVVLRAAGPAARAAVSMVDRDGGTGLHLSLAGAPAHGWCALVARAGDGRSETAATWPANGGARVEATGTTAIPRDRLTELDVVTDTGRTLVSIPVPQP